MVHKSDRRERLSDLNGEKNKAIVLEAFDMCAKRSWGGTEHNYIDFPTVEQSSPIEERPNMTVMSGLIVSNAGQSREDSR